MGAGLLGGGGAGRIPFGRSGTRGRLRAGQRVQCARHYLTWIPFAPSQFRARRWPPINFTLSQVSSCWMTMPPAERYASWCDKRGFNHRFSHTCPTAACMSSRPPFAPEKGVRSRLHGPSTGGSNRYMVEPRHRLRQTHEDSSLDNADDLIDAPPASTLLMSYPLKEMQNFWAHSTILHITGAAFNAIAWVGCRYSLGNHLRIVFQVFGGD